MTETRPSIEMALWSPAVSESSHEYNVEHGRPFGLSLRMLICSQTMPTIMDSEPIKCIKTFQM
jgi:hypothetical protein